MMPSFGTMAANANQPNNNPLLQTSSTTSPPLLYPQPLLTSTPPMLFSYVPVLAPPPMSSQYPFWTTPTAVLVPAPMSLTASQGKGTGLSQARKGSYDGYAPRKSNQQMGLRTDAGATRQGASVDDKDVFDPFGIGAEVTRRGRKLLYQLAMGGGGLVKKKRGWEAEEDEDKVHLCIEMPGLGKEHVTVSVEQSAILVIHGANSQEPTDQPSSLPPAATGSGRGRRFNFKFHFPKEVFKMDAVKGDMKNGLLELIVPKLKIVVQVQLF